MARKKRKKKTFSSATEVRAIARERVGAVPPAHAIEPREARRKPKHKKPPDAEDAG